ncbi:hypothetical protein [Dongia sp.]|uniref:hypothetical protein n=1 Tax=Dongia sp. TaxID=1977262 RepID=UPI0035B01FEC
MHPILQQIADALLRLKGVGAFDPLAVPPQVLPHLFILELHPDSAAGSHLRVRLTGTALDRAFERNLRGHDLEEFLHGPYSADVLAGFHRCAAEHKPIWMRQIVSIRDKVPRFVEGVACFVAPNLIYGGLVFGEIARSDAPAGFEMQLL